MHPPHLVFRLGERRLDLIERLEAFRQLLAQPLGVQFQQHVHDVRVVGRQHPSDLLRRHLTTFEHSRPIRTSELIDHRSRSFGVSNMPSPAANSRIPTGVPITVSISIPPVMNRTVPMTNAPNDGSSGPT